MEEESSVYKAINKLDSRITKIEEALPFLKDILDRNTASNEKLVATLHEVELSMVKLNNKIDSQSNDLQEMKHNLEESTKKADERISTLGGRISAVEEKSKFDMVDYLKKNFPWIVVILGMGALYASSYVKVL